MAWENTDADSNAAVIADTDGDGDADAIVDPDADADANAVADEAADADDTTNEQFSRWAGADADAVADAAVGADAQKLSGNPLQSVLTSKRKSWQFQILPSQGALTNSALDLLEP